jgi:hypothetical protein
LLVTDNGSGLAAGSVEAERSGVAEIVDRSGQGSDIADIIIARVLAVEEIEEFGEGTELNAFCMLPKSS